MENETREIVRDYLNEVMSISKITKHEKELMNKFEIEICSVCENFELEEDLVYHKWDLAQEEELICEDCRNSE